MATIPGMDFDPKERAFDIDELRPQPIIRKRKKLIVADDSKVRTLLVLFSLDIKINPRMTNIGTKE